MCEEYFGHDFAECEASWHMYQGQVDLCHEGLNDCDYERFIREEQWWYPIDDKDAEREAWNWIAVHPFYGWVDINEPVIANAPYYCHEDYNYIWDCGY